MRKRFTLISVLLCFLIGCQPSTRDENEIYIGVISGPEAELMEVAKQEAAQNNLTLKIFEFEDYNMPNIALAEGAIDANMFQHQPYLDIVNQQRHLELVTIGKMYIYPMAIYSKKHSRLQDIPQGAKIGIPNDPSNEARAMLLLQSAGLIELSSNDLLTLTPEKISKNAKGLIFQELMAAQLPRVLEEVDAACINTNYAVAAGLSPTKDSLFHEGKNSPYVNIVVVRKGDKDSEKYQKLMSALHSEAVQQKAKTLFGDAAIIGWTD